MNDDEPITTREQQLVVGRYFREMLSTVEPQHVPDMLHMFYQFQTSEEPMYVPEGTWRMPMPHGYTLRGEGPVGVALEPPPAREGLLKRARFNTLDTAEILALCAQARTMQRPERDPIVTQLYGLNMAWCDSEAVEAIELLTCALLDTA